MWRQGDPEPAPTTSEWIIVRNSRIHGKGVFAAKDIPKGTKIIEYVGEWLTKKQAEKRADEQLEKAAKNKEVGAVYLFELNKRYDIDGFFKWNTARLINHSCNPNAETDVTKGHIWITALRDIKKGEEISYDYGYDFENWADHPCQCGSENCVGFIVSQKHWKKLKRITTSAKPSIPRK